jgi:hypothetical protein
MIVGMLPIALAQGAGAEVENGMAWVIIGGLTSSLLLTLVLVPSIYMIIEKVKIKVNGWLVGRRLFMQFLFSVIYGMPFQVMHHGSLLLAGGIIALGHC